MVIQTRVPNKPATRPSLTPALLGLHPRQAWDSRIDGPAVSLSRFVSSDVHACEWASKPQLNSLEKQQRQVRK